MPERIQVLIEHVVNNKDYPFLVVMRTTNVNEMKVARRVVWAGKTIVEAEEIKALVKSVLDAASRLWQVTV